MSAEKPFILYGAAGSGSVAVEAAMTLLGLDYQVVESAPWGTAGEQANARRYNPLGQVPTLVLPGGEVMTESAAILIWLGDRYVHGGLAPRPEDRRRVAYLRWMVYVPAAIYWNYTVRDYPERFVEGEAAQEQLKAACRQRIIDNWAAMEAQLDPAPFLLGHSMSLLDVYVATTSRWTPRRKVFRQHCPKMTAAVERVDADPRLTEFWKRRFPFDAGWDEEAA